jgi:hypothetical protein
LTFNTSQEIKNIVDLVKIGLFEAKIDENGLTKVAPAAKVFKINLK